MRISTQKLEVRSIDQSNVEQRQILFISQSNGSSLPLQRLRSTGWKVIHYKLNDAFEEIEHCQVGMVQFDQFDQDFAGRLQKLFSTHPAICWLALVEKSALNDERLKKLIKDCFYDFHTLPLDLNRLNIVLGHAYGFARLFKEAGDHAIKSIDENGIVGISPPMVQLRKLIRKAATTDSPILICGESGTGKELVAASIHTHSAQGDGPFVAVNCASLPASLIQSELFGHEKGAFTGAHAKKIGHIESAAGGTLFLDEIGDLSPALQVNLLRFLQEKTITRVGGHEEITVNARIIAATNVDLEKAIKEGTFRQDLFYRLNVIRIATPSLRERREDIEFLAHHFFNKHRSQSKRVIAGFSSDALLAMNQYDWPGNIRELSNRVLRALVISEGKLITAEDLDLNSGNANQGVASLEAVRSQAEAKAILAMMIYTKKNMSEAARLLGITRATLYRLISKHHILPSRQFSNADNDILAEER